MEYKEKLTEFEIQAEVFCFLKKSLKNFIIRGEYKFCANKEAISKGSKKGIRTDIAIFDKSFKPILIIEIKKNNNGVSTRQAVRYSKFLNNINVIYIRGTYNKKELLDYINTLS